MDPLSDVLRAVRLNGAHFYMVEAAHPWSILTVEATKLVPRIHSASEHLISYHILTSGSCWGGIAGDQQVLMQPGDAIVFSHGDANLMSSERSRVVDAATIAATPSRYPTVATVGDGSGAEVDVRLRIPRLRPAPVQSTAFRAAPPHACARRRR